MIVRDILATDLEQLRTIHKQYDFPFPDFSKMISRFAITDLNDKIIIAGGVRFITEAILLTDKFSPSAVRRDALIEARALVQFISKSQGQEHVHAFINDPEWEAVLIKHGFRESNGKALIIG